MSNKLTLTDLDDSALYDVFYDAGTDVRSALLQAENKALADGDMQKVRQCREEDIALRRDRVNVDPDDRETQIACTERWDRRAREIEEELGLDRKRAVLRSQGKVANSQTKPGV